MGSLFNPIAVVPQVKYAWVTYQEIVTIVGPVQDDLYEIIHETSGCKILFMEVRQVNTATDGEEIDILVTQDGNAWLYDSSDIGQLVHNTKYAPIAHCSNIDQPVYDLDAAATPNTPLVLQNLDASMGEPLDGKDILVQLRQTSGVGAGQEMSMKITYKVKEAI